MLIRRAIVLIFSLVIMWQLFIIVFGLPVYILPPPAQVILCFKKNGALIAFQFLFTLFETLIGLAAAIFFGMLAAFAMSTVRVVQYWLSPLTIISQAIPTFALAPLLVLWFGYGLLSKMLTIIVILFFPITSAFYEGLSKIKPQWLDLAKIMAGKKWRVLWYIRFPAALPNLVSGIKIATAFAPLAAITSEWVGASQGIGFLMLNANARLETDLLFACLLVIIIFSSVLYLSIVALLDRLVRWR